jgi:phosphomannomutase
VSTIRFGTDGWRAIIADEFTYASVRLVAQGIADALGAPAGAAVVVGYDTRFASDRFALAVAEVLAANELRVILADRPAPTPALAYAVAQRGAAGGVVITASHNPAIFSGIKVKTAQGSAAGAEEVAAIEAAIARRAGGGEPVRRLDAAAAEAAGLLERVDLGPEYHARLAALVDLEAIRQAGVTVVTDAMYGAGGGHYPALLAGGSTRVVELNGQPNPAFPGLRGPEPIAANLVQLGRVVAESRSALGLALDGDADRIGFVDERGRYVNQQRVFALLTLYLIEQRGWRGPIIKSVNATTMLDRLAEQHGLATHTTPVGFKYLGPALLAQHGLIAGEESGGFAFRGHIPERDGILAGLFLIDLLRRLGLPASGLVDELHRRLGPYAYDRLDLTFDPAQRAALTERARAAQPARLADRAVLDISYLDGVKFVLEDGCWLLIRFSGTEPLLRLYAEGRGDEEVARLLQRGRELLGLA